jgi:hypothetical protein
VIGDLVAHDLHNVVAVGDKTKRQSCREDGKLPDGNRRFGLGGFTCVPGAVDDGPGSNGVTDIVGTVSKRGSASSENLNKRVCVLDLVRVLLGMAVDTLHTCTFGSTVDTGLSSVDVVVDAIESTDHDLSRNALQCDDHVLLLIDFARLDLVLVEVTHSPSERTTLRPELGVEALLTLFDKLLVSKLAVFLDDSTLLGAGSSADLRVTVVVLQRDLVIVLNHSVVGNNGSNAIFLGGTLEKERTLKDMPPAYVGIALHDLGVQVGNEEDERQGSQSDTAGHGNGCDVPRWLLVESEVGRSLVDDRESADGSCDEEEEGCGPDGPWDWVFAEMNNQLDQHEDDGTEASRGDRSHSKASKDSSKTLALVPSPLDFGSASDGNTYTSDRRDERVRGRDVSRVLGAPHDPEGCTSEGAGESQHLNAGVALESVGRNDAVLDGLGGTGTDSNGTHHLEDGTKDHGLAVGDGARGDRSSPRVGDIVCRQSVLGRV